MNKKVLLLGGIGLTILVLIMVVLTNGGSKPKEVKPANQIAQVEVSEEQKINIGRYILVSNALHQKTLEYVKDLNRSIPLFIEGKLSEAELITAINNTNRKSTYFYLLAQKLEQITEGDEATSKVKYNLYLTRRATEELLKYIDDKSDIRLKVGQDLLEQTIERENEVNQSIAKILAKYDINTESVFVDSSVFTDDVKFLESLSDTVIFKDLTSEEFEKYEYYLKTVNDNFMLVSWELQNIYLAKTDYENGKINVNQLISTTDKSNYVITTAYNNLMLQKAPEDLYKLEKDTQKTMTLYRDALLEIQKFNLDFQLQHYTDAMKIIEQADTEAGRIGEFIYSVRYQYRSDI